MKKITSSINSNLLITLLLSMLLIITIALSRKFNENILILELLLLTISLISIYLFTKELMLLKLTIFSSLVMMFFSENLGMNKNILLIIDYFIILIFIRLFYLILCRKIKFHKLNLIFIGFIVFSIVGIIINKSSFTNYIKVIYEDYLRYFIVFFAAINFSYKYNDIKKGFKELYVFILAQIPIIIIQLKQITQSYTGGYVIQDYASGLLGGKSTAELGGILCIVFMVIFQCYKMKRVSKGVFLFSIAMIITISILSEIKFVLFIIPIFVFLMSLDKLNIKTIIMILISVIFIIEGMNIIAKVNPGFENFFTKEKIQEYISHSYGGSGISRGNSLELANYYINYDFNKIVVGNGIGSSTAVGTDTSEFSKSNIYYFRIFYWPYVLVETGYLGIMLMLSFYIAIIQMSIKISKSSIDEYKLIGNIGIPLIALIIFMNYYAMSMVKVNFAILTWGVLGIITKKYYEMKEGKHEFNT